MKKIIKIKIDNTIDVGEISMDTKELKFTYRDVMITIPCSEPFTPYNDISALREKLEKKHIILLINASRFDVWPSGMMSAGYKGYVHEMGKRPTNMVNILDDVESLVHIGTVAEGEIYSDKWSKSFDALLPSYINDEIIWQKHSEGENFYFIFRKGKAILLLINKTHKNTATLIEGFSIWELDELPKNWTLEDVQNVKE